MTVEEVYKSREKSIEAKNDETFFKHYRKFEFLKSNLKKMGQFFLYEKCQIKNGLDIITYPKLGLYLNSLPCDQTIEVEWVDYRRTWEWNVEYDFEYKINNETKIGQNYIAEIETKIQRMPLLNDNMLVYGVWDSMPSWLQLRQAYEKTWWFHRNKDELRDIQLNRLLK